MGCVQQFLENGFSQLMPSEPEIHNAHIIKERGSIHANGPGLLEKRQGLRQLTLAECVHAGFEIRTSGWLCLCHQTTGSNYQ